MSGERDPFDVPRPVGPLGQAMTRLTDDAPDADFTAWTVRSRHENARSARRQVIGGLAAGVAAIGVLVLVATTVGGGSASVTASSVSSESVATRSSAAAAAAVPGMSVSGSTSSASSAAASSSASSSAASSSLPSAAVGDGATPPAPAPAASTPPAATGEPGGSPADGGGDATAGGGVTGGPSSEAGCRTVPLTAAGLQAVADAVAGLTPLDACAADEGDLGVQRYAVAGGSLVVEVRAGSYDPCAATGDTACSDVAGHPGVRTRAAADGARTQVWISGRDGSVVLTAEPGDAVPVEALAVAAEGLAAAS